MKQMLKSLLLIPGGAALIYLGRLILGHQSSSAFELALLCAIVGLGAVLYGMAHIWDLARGNG